VRAVRLAPDSATLYTRLAIQREELGGDPVPDLQRAAELDPANAERYLRLGGRAELAGDAALAERSLLRAAVLSRLYQPRFSLAGYYFRRENADMFHKWLVEALRAAYGDVAPLLELGWRTQPDAAELWRSTIPHTPEIERQFLIFLMDKRQAPAAAPFAIDVAAHATAEDRPALIRYCGWRLFENGAADALAVWNALCSRNLVPYHGLDPPGGISLTNGDFDRAPTGGGFDWRLQPQPGVTLPERRGELRAAFTGEQPEFCAMAWQFVPVMPGRRYRLRGDWRPIEGDSPSGLGWAVYDWANHPVIAEEAPDGSIAFTASADLLRLAWVYRRPVGSVRFEGVVSLRNVRLEMEK
jgi:hypothetical protein